MTWCRLGVWEFCLLKNTLHGPACCFHTLTTRKRWCMITALTHFFTYTQLHPGMPCVQPQPSEFVEGVECFIFRANIPTVGNNLPLVWPLVDPAVPDTSLCIWLVYPIETWHKKNFYIKMPRYDNTFAKYFKLCTYIFPHFYSVVFKLRGICNFIQNESAFNFIVFH